MTISSFQNGSYLNSGVSSNSTIPVGSSIYSSFYNTETLDRKYEYTDTKEGYEIGYAGRDAVISTCVSNITSLISEGREDDALEAYNELLSEMKAQDRYSQLVGEDGNDSQLRAIARQIIESELEDDDLKSFIEDNCVGASGRSWQKTFLNNGKIDDATEEDLLEAMCNIKEEKHVSAGQYFLEGICHALVVPRLFSEIGDALFGGKHH